MAEFFEKDNYRYKDMLDLPHHVSLVHPPMPMEDRAAQFSPFAALTGFGEVIRETERLTQERVELGEDARNILDEKLRALQGQIKSQPQVAVTYFQQDARKEGGAYCTVTGCIQKIDVYGGVVAMADGTKIPVNEIVELPKEKVPRRPGWGRD